MIKSILLTILVIGFALTAPVFAGTTVLQYGFDATSGDVVTPVTDDSGLGNDGNVVHDGAAPVYTSDIPVSVKFVTGIGSVDFTDTNAAISTSSALGAGASPNPLAQADVIANGGLTMEVWVKNISSTTLAGAALNIGGMYVLGVNGAGDVGFFRGDDSNDTAWTVNTETTEWTHLAVVMTTEDALTYDITSYINGTEISTGSNTFPWYLDRAASTGNHQWADWADLEGLVYEPRISLGTLDPSEFTFVPVQASGPIPANGEGGVSTDVTLEWFAGETAETHRVYFGLDPNSMSLQGEVSETSYAMSGLDYNETYLWRVDEVEADGTTVYEGNIWTFSTTVLPPTDPVPGNGAINVDEVATASLQWNGSADSYDVYMGNTVESMSLLGNVTTTSVDVTLAAETQYYWQVVSKAGTSEVAGDIWVFVTAFAPRTELDVTDGLQLRLNAMDADSLTIGDGDAVTAWADVSGNGLSAAGSLGSPIYVADGLRSLPTVEFAGGDDSMLVDDSLSITSEFTIIVVKQVKPANTYTTLLNLMNQTREGVGLQAYTWGGNAGENSIVRLFADASASDPNVTEIRGAYDWQANQGATSAYVYDGASVVQYLNGAPVAVADAMIPAYNFDGTGSLVIGGQWFNSEMTSEFAGSISELLIYNRALSGQEIQQVESYLGNIWIIDYCGQEGQQFNSMDFNMDCVVDMVDFAAFASEWLDCTDASGVNCQ